MANKSSADPSGNYGDYLADLVDSNKDEFTEEELEVLHKDIETIRGIEEKNCSSGKCRNPGNSS